MSALDIYERPTCPISRNWADDDEDDFDLDTWQAADNRTSAPDFNSLPPLQLFPVEDEENFVVHGAKAIREEALQATFEDDILYHYQAPTMCEPSAHALLAERAIQDRCGKPAFFELSHGENGLIHPDFRVQYSSNWKKTKVEWGLDCRHTVLMRMSKMCEVETIELEEDEMDHEEDDSSMLTLTVTNEVNESALIDQHLDTLDTLPSHKVDMDSDAESLVSSVPSVPSEILKLLPISDEGYYSGGSRSTSPTLQSVESGVKTTYCATQVGISYARSFSKRSSRVDPRAVYGTEGPAGLWPLHATFFEAVDKNVADTEETPSLSEAFVKSWCHVTSMSWGSAAIVGAGVLAGTGLWFSRRR